jgi:eukaryotic-like serine/threonine-protein kinase
MADVGVQRDGADRFELRGELGSGGVGIVYRVLDRQRGEEVALKTMSSRSGRDIFRFKREFRSLAELEHPNLVRLHELFSVGDEWMFTMELVDGRPFADRAALPQLVDGVCALHAAGKIHRDLKPSNVLVEAGGRVVILDFGLVSDVDPHVADRTHEHTAVGTPAYMSPEQAADLPLTPASDWYSVGTMLYQVLSGRRPFAQTSYDVLVEKQLRDPPDLRTLLPGDALADLTMRMLSRNPEARPSDAEILAAVGIEASPATRAIAARRRERPATRSTELAQLHAAFADSRQHHVLVVINGPLGSGKTTLLNRFLDEARAGGAIIFQAAENGRESLPMPSIDRLVDAYATWLLSLPPREAAELVPPRISAAQRVFPTLRRVPAASAPAMPGSIPTDREQLVRQAFYEMVECTRRVAARYPLILAVDDVQLGTSLTLELIAAQASAGERPAFLDIYTHDPGDGVAILDVLRAHGDVRVIEL